MQLVYYMTSLEIQMQIKIPRNPVYLGKLQFILQIFQKINY